MIYVTHDPIDGMSVGDRVALLHSGLLQQVDDPEAVYRRPCNRIVASYIGLPGMKFLDGELFEDSKEMKLRATLCEMEVPGLLRPLWGSFCHAPLTLGIRPENVSVTGNGAPVATASPSWTKLGMELAWTENCGDRTLAYLRREDWLLTAWLDPSLSASLQGSEGKQIGVELNMATAHLFDRKTGKALWHPP
jgi:multiple sugar transport system ATP-binding protein